VEHSVDGVWKDLELRLRGCGTPVPRRLFVVFLFGISIVEPPVDGVVHMAAVDSGIC